jgi:NADH-quinone oxidoreductase subunit K
MLQHYLLVGAILFGLGLAGFLVRRNLIVIFLCAEMMLQGVSLSLTAWGAYHNTWDGQLLVVFIITVAACEAAIALALILMLCRRVGSLDVTQWQQIREAGTAPFVDVEIPEEKLADEHWPTLTPAGIEPEPNLQEQLYRSHV